MIHYGLFNDTESTAIITELAFSELERTGGAIIFSFKVLVQHSPE
jgi:hypothetical protein